jgi:hypothetical protein
VIFNVGGWHGLAEVCHGVVTCGLAQFAGEHVTGFSLFCGGLFGLNLLILWWGVLRRAFLFLQEMACVYLSILQGGGVCAFADGAV